MPGRVWAAQITDRTLAIGSSAAGATTSHNYTFTPASGVILSVDFLYCTTPSGTCTTPTGLDTTGASLNGQPAGLGSGGTWTIGGTPTNGRVQIANASNTGSPSAGATVNFNGIINPSTPNETFFVRITTYSDAGWTTAIDSGTVAASTASQITVTATVDEGLSFCVYTNANCGAGGNSVNLGTLSELTTGTGTSKMEAATHAPNGYVITYTGATLTSGSNTIAPMNPATTSATSTSQFGLNLVANTTPSVGANVTGAGSGTAQGSYAIANTFKFLPGDTVASASARTDSNVFTVSYIANISSAVPPGIYSTVITYICTSTF